MTPQEKREIYFKQNPLVYELYCQIKHDNEIHWQGGTVLQAIKQYAIEHTQLHTRNTFSDYDKT